VMSTPAYVDSESITQADGAQSSRVPIPLPDDPYVAVSQAQLVDTDTESDPEEAPSEVEELQLVCSRVPFMGKEFKAFEPSGTRTDSSHSLASSDSTAPWLPDHLLTHVSPTPTPTRASFHHRTTCMTVRAQLAMSPGLSASMTEAMALSDSAFRKRYRSSYEIPSSSSSLALPIRKRYKGTSEDESLDADDERERLDDEDHGLDDEDRGLDDEDRGLDDEDRGLDDEDHGLDDEDRGLDDEGLGLEEEEEAAPEVQQQAVPVVDTTASEPLGLGYGAARRRALEPIEEIAPSTYEVDLEDDRVYTDIPVYPTVAPVQTPLSPEWSYGSLLVSPSSPVVLSPIDSPVATPTATISVDEDQFLEVGAQLELHRSILHDHTKRLDALPPTLFEDIDRDVRELYIRSGVVKDEIFSQRYRFKSLEREQERTAVMFGALWRPVLALEAWAGHVDTQLADTSWDRYDDHRLIHDMLVQQAAMRREFQDMKGYVAALE
ncbi:hypothetical protein Tco_1433488, partial [Tanacetum coccineum]